MNAAEAAVAHHQNVIARLCGFHHHVHQRVEIRAPVRRLHAGIRHFRHLPRNVVRLEQEHFVGAAERRRQIVLLMPIFMVLERGSSTARMRAVPPTLPRNAARVADRRRMVCKVVVNRDAVGFATQFQTAAGVDEIAQRAAGVRRLYANMTGGGDGHQTVMHVVLAHQRPVHFADLFAVEEHRVMAGIRRQLLCTPVPSSPPAPARSSSPSPSPASGGCRCPAG